MITFIDELHTIVGAGAAEGAMDAGNMIKPMLARGELRMIGATTLDEYRKHIEKDAALERRFQPVYVAQPSVEDTMAILRGLEGAVRGPPRGADKDSALVAAAVLSDRYISSRFLPDKAIDLMDEAASGCGSRSTPCRPRSTWSNGGSGSSRSSAWRWRRRTIEASRERLAKWRRRWPISRESSDEHEGALADREGRHRRHPRA